MQRNNTKQIKYLRPGIRPYVVFTLIFALPLCLYAYTAVTEDAVAWKVVLLITSIMTVLYLWTFLHRIGLYEDKISFYSPFTGTKIIKKDDIGRWAIKIGVFNYLDRLKPTVRLEIEHANHNGKIVIPIKLFKDEDIRNILEWLPEDKEEQE